MNAAELRIGNLVLFKGNKIKIESVEISYCEQYREEFNETFKPIELTEEILLKCEFEKDDIDQYENGTRFGLFTPKEFDGYVSVWGESIIGKCKYLHQLQNLYFYLTGEELEIKDLEL